MNRFRKTVKTAASGILCLSLLFSQAGICLASQADAGSPPAMVYYDEWGDIGYFDDYLNQYVYYDENFHPDGAEPVPYGSDPASGSDSSYSNDSSYSSDSSGSAAATPTPDPHMPAYYEPVSTDSVEGWPAGPAIEGGAAIAMDASTGAILYSKNADARMYPASITKIMTALLACENLNPDDTYAINESAAYGIEPGSSSIYADTGEIFTVEQELMALMLESANEIALALAEQTAGSVKKFVEMMNERARQLGCTGTHFNNPNGLPDESHYTTASDMAKIAKAAWNNRTFRKYATTDTYEIPPTNVMQETRYMRNHHGMMSGHDHAYEGVLGGKTGYTVAAGNTLVTYATDGKLGIITVVLNSINGAYPDTAALLDYSFRNFERISLKYKKDPVPKKFLPCERFILRNCGNTYPFYATRKYYATVPVGTTLDSLTKESSVTRLCTGPYIMEDTYSFNGYYVGYGIQKEREILSDLLLIPSL